MAVFTGVPNVKTGLFPDVKRGRLWLMQAEQQERVIEILVRAFPDVQAVYLFGSSGTADETVSSDVDIAILLPPNEAKSLTGRILFDVRCALENVLRRDVDLVNVREANMVFRNEVVKDVRRIYCADTYAADVFEMLTMSFYQKLNEERSDILAEIAASGRILDL
jgi:predicted nucleotidyltransferase